MDDRHDDDEAPPEPADDRPPICPACGVTMGISLGEGAVHHVCLECGFADDLE
jgi:predicted RNA-binding Zn-ribbon protein involved in translation (DUF1610 family)